ncbi:MAG: response regulator [Puniceicoccales bacterium]|jgi:two-component system alkaline phosphatase synthesis response regulator PhoP|nr:response regulator [Puniceicoccales bacterium]
MQSLLLHFDGVAYGPKQAAVKDSKLTPFVLVADDDLDLANGVAKYFCDANFGACAVRTLGEASRILADHFVNLLVLNVSIQGHSSVEFLGQLQRNGQHVPTIFLTAKNSQPERLGALSVGDDIMQKPLVLNELVARARAVLRRAATARDWHLTENVTLNDSPFHFCGATVHPRDMKVVFPCGDAVPVGKKEVGLMAVFSAATGGKIVSRKDIIHSVWGLHANIRSRSLDQYVVRIRHLFRNNGCGGIDSLRTIHGIGFLCVTDEEDADSGKLSRSGRAAAQETQSKPLQRTKRSYLPNLAHGKRKESSITEASATP